MTTATEPRTHDELERLVKDRWDTLTIGIDGYDGTETNSKLISRWMADTRTILAGMIHGANGPEEYSKLADLEDALVSILTDRAHALALEIETQRV